MRARSAPPVVEPQASPDPATTSWVPIWNMGTGVVVPSPVVNGQWVKGVGGAAVWSPITTDDFASQQPCVTLSAATQQTFAAGLLPVVMTSLVTNAGGSIFGVALNPAQVTLTKAGWYSFCVTTLWNDGAQDVQGKIWYLGGSHWPGGAACRPGASTNYGRDGFTLVDLCNAPPSGVTLSVNNQGTLTDRLSQVHFTVVYLGKP